MRRDRYQRTEVSDQIGQSREELFTPRRQGAKAAYESKDRIPFLNLRDFASLREIAAVEGKEEFFTPRRGGAKNGGTSKQQRSVGLSSRASISVPNLSGFASLRETSVRQGRPASAGGYGSARAGLHSKPAEEES